MNTPIASTVHALDECGRVAIVSKPPNPAQMFETAYELCRARERDGMVVDVIVSFKFYDAVIASLCDHVGTRFGLRPADLRKCEFFPCASFFDGRVELRVVRNSRHGNSTVSMIDFSDLVGPGMAPMSPARHFVWVVSGGDFEQKPANPDVGGVVVAAGPEYVTLKLSPLTSSAHLRVGDVAVISKRQP